MPRRPNPIPSYTLHKATGQARCRIGGKDFYLGPFGSPESRQRYGELVAQHANGLAVDPFHRSHYHGTTTNPGDDPGPSVAELWLAFLKHAERYYVKRGEQTAEVKCLKAAMAPVIDLFGLLLTGEFGPTQLKAARAKMIAAGWCRKYINKSICRVRHVFRWGIENDMVEPATLARLVAVAPLKRGKSDAPDRPPREAVPQADIDAVKKRSRQQNRDLMDLQLMTEARPGELLMLTPGMIDRTGQVWVATLQDHKCLHHGTTRKLHFGPKCQLILARYFKADPDAPLFSIGVDTYRECVVQACRRAGVKHFSPYWLRHNAATSLRDEYGTETAQAMLGHSKPDMTAAYSRKLDKLATEAATKCGRRMREVWHTGCARDRFSGRRGDSERPARAIFRFGGRHFGRPERWFHCQSHGFNVSCFGSPKTSKL